jgi:hypothetical protein
MIKSALEFLMGAGKAEVIEIDDAKFTTKPVHRVKFPEIESIKISTLTGLVNYINTNPDNLEIEDLLLHIRDEKTVEVLSPLLEDASRYCYIQAHAKTPQIRLGSFLSMEEFNVMLQSCFLDAADRGKVLEITGCVKEESIKNTSDNGITQSVVARTGIATVGYVDVPNPVTLVPFRTFIEVEQPESKFVLRMKDGPSACLFEADGGEWRLASMLRIKKYLEEKLPNMKIIA